MKNQDNGNVQLNSARNEFNDRVEAKSYLGRTKKLHGQVQEDSEAYKSLISSFHFYYIIQFIRLSI